MQQRIISRVIRNLVERPPLKYLICVQDSVRNFYLKQKILQIVIFRKAFFYLNQQNPEKKIKNSKFLQVSTKKVIFEAKKIVSTTCQTRLNIFLPNPFWFTDKRKQNWR